MMRGRRLALALPLAAAFAASGCVSLAARIGEPRGSATFAGPALARMLEQDGIRRRDFTTPDGVRLSWLDIPAAERGFEYDYRLRIDRGEFTASFEGRTAHAPVAVPARGTVVFLHGWGMDATSMLGWAEALSERGWHGAALDLRNFGASARAPAGYGTREARDVAALVDALRERGDTPDPAFLFGVSYGAATALFAEPLLRGQIAGVVAMEPFGNAADAIRDLARHEGAGAGVDRAIAAAGRRLGLDLGAIDTATPLASSRTCTLLLHGARDRLVPVAAARRLAAAAPAARYLEFPDENHFTLPLRIDLLAAPLAGWLDATGAGGCQAPTIPGAVAGQAHGDASGWTPISVTSVESQGLGIDAASRPYFECLAAAMRSIGSGASGLDAALAASEARCAPERDALYRSLLQEDWTTTSGDVATQTREDAAALVLSLYEAGFRKRLEVIFRQAR